jgi:hypothetical protein
MEDDFLLDDLAAVQGTNADDGGGVFEQLPVSDVAPSSRSCYATTLSRPHTILCLDSGLALVKAASVLVFWFAYVAPTDLCPACSHQTRWLVHRISGCGSCAIATWCLVVFGFPCNAFCSSHQGRQAARSSRCDTTSGVLGSDSNCHCIVGCSSNVGFHCNCDCTTDCVECGVFVGVIDCLYSCGGEKGKDNGCLWFHWYATLFCCLLFNFNVICI